MNEGGSLHVVSTAVDLSPLPSGLAHFHSLHRGGPLMACPDSWRQPAAGPLVQSGPPADGELQRWRRIAGGQLPNLLASFPVADHWLAALQPMPPGFAGALGLQWAPPLVAGTAAAFVPAPVCMHLLGVHLLELVLLLQLGLPAVA